MAMKNPPRRTTIRGQKHLLAYITPEEAALLKAMGGSGEKVNGIPAYPGGFGGEGMGGFGDMDDGGATASGDVDAGWGGGDEDEDQSVQQDLAAAAAAAQGVDLGGYQFDEGFDPGSRQTARDVYDTMMAIRTATGLNSKAARDQILGYARNQLQNRMINANALMQGYPVSFLGKTFRVPSIPGMIGGLLGKANLSNMERVLGTQGSIPAFDVTGKFQGVYDADGIYSGNDTSPAFDDGRGPDTVPATTNPVTGEQQCPDGYMFDEDLQACRLAGGLPGGDGTTGYGELGPATGDLYGRMGLLDIAPTGLGMFKQRFGAGFGTPSEFSAANTDFRKTGGVRRPYPGYTILS